jgi:hypothetical protein
MAVLAVNGEKTFISVMIFDDDLGIILQWRNF